MAPHSSTLAWKIPVDGGAWWAAVHAKSRTRLHDFTWMRTARFICVCFNSVFCVVIFDVLCLATMWCRHATILLELDFLSLCLETRALRNTYLDHL